MTEAELLEALRAALDEKPDLEGMMGVPDMAAKLGVGKDRIRQLIREWIAEGRMQVVWVHTIDVAGRRNKQPRYRLLRQVKVVRGSEAA